jgi:hypothetical protein
MSATISVAAGKKQYSGKPKDESPRHFEVREAAGLKHVT